MKTSISKLAGVAALLCSSMSMAATINITPSNSTLNVGDPFSLLVSGVDFPSTAGATLGLTYDSAVVDITSVTLATGSPFTGGVVSAEPFSLVSILGPLVGTLPSGNFDAFVISGTAVGAGSANITLVDDGADLCWSAEDVNVGCIQGVVYNQATVTVGVIPLPAAAWLLAPAVLAAGRFAKRRKAA